VNTAMSMGLLITCCCPMMLAPGALYASSPSLLASCRRDWRAAAGEMATICWLPTRPRLAAACAWWDLAALFLPSPWVAS
jgi:hypothetical protein